MKARALAWSGLLTALAAAQSWTPLPPSPRARTVPPMAGWEENRGQARAEVLLVSRGFEQTMTVEARGIFYAPHLLKLAFPDANESAAVSRFDPQPGFANVYSASAAGWVRRIPRWGRVRLEGLFPGVDAWYLHNPAEGLRLRWEFAAGVDPALVRMETQGGSPVLDGGRLVVRLRTSRPAYACTFAPPLAGQGGEPRAVRYKLDGGVALHLEVDGRDPRRPLVVEMPLAAPIAGRVATAPAGFLEGANGDWFTARRVNNASTGLCAVLPNQAPVACSDVSVESYTAQGELRWVSYLRGAGDEVATALQWVRGELLIAGTTESADFPVNADAPQAVYGGPRRTGFIPVNEPPPGDVFLTRMHPQDGALLRSTYWGGPLAETAVPVIVSAADGGIYLLGSRTAGMPVTAGSPACGRAGCGPGHVTKLDGGLTRAIYATYLPGDATRFALAPDGSVYFAGTAGQGFPVSSRAFQPVFGGGTRDGVVGRLAPEGDRLLFATYYGGPGEDAAPGLLAAPGGVWLIGGEGVARMEERGERLPARYPLLLRDWEIDGDGRLRVLTRSLAAAPGSLSVNACGAAYAVLPLEGEAADLHPLPEEAKWPWESWEQVFAELRAADVVSTGRGQFRFNAGPAPVGAAPVARCVVSAADRSVANITSPGALISLLGAGLGAAAQADLSTGLLPLTLGGTRLWVGDRPAPLLLVSPGQINAVVPADVAGVVDVVVEVSGVRSEVLKIHVEGWRPSLFVDVSRAARAATVVNEDGSLNSPARPARRGSWLVFYGTGAAETIFRTPPGSLHPNRLAPFLVPVTLYFGPVAVRPEYAGGAPGAIVGLGQFNVRLPGDIAGEVRVEIEAGGGARSWATVYVEK